MVTAPSEVSRGSAYENIYIQRAFENIFKPGVIENIIKYIKEIQI